MKEESISFKLNGDQVSTSMGIRAIRAIRAIRDLLVLILSRITRLKRMTRIWSSHKMHFTITFGVDTMKCFMLLFLQRWYADIVPFQGDSP